MVLFFLWQVSHGQLQNLECFEGGKFNSIAKGDFFIHQGKNIVLFDFLKQDKFTVLDLRTKKISSYKKSKNSHVTLLNDDRIAYNIGLNFSNLSQQELLNKLRNISTTILDPESSSTIEKRGYLPIGNALYKLKEVQNQNLLIFENDFGNLRRMRVPNTISGIDVRWSDHENEPDVLQNKENNRIEFIKNDSVFAAVPLGNVNQSLTESGIFTPDHRFYIAQINENSQGGSILGQKIAIIDTKTKKIKFVTVPNHYNANIKLTKGLFDVYSNNFHQILLRAITDDGSFGILDLNSGKIKSIKEIKENRSQYAKIKPVCSFKYDYINKKIDEMCFDFKQMNFTIRPLFERTFASDVTQISDTEHIITTRSDRINQQSFAIYTSKKKICPRRIVPVTCDCQLHGRARKDKHWQDIKDLSFIASCAKKSDPTEWDQIPLENLQVLDENTSVKILLRFSKPGGFDPERHLGILLGMINASIHTKYPAEFKAALLGILYTSDRLYESLINRYPELKNLKEVPNLVCIQDEEKKILQNAVYDYINARMTTIFPKDFRDFSYLFTLAREYLPKKLRESLIETLTEQLSIVFINDPDLPDIFFSKTRKFLKNKIKSALGLSYDDLTDLTIVRRGDNLHLIQLGLDHFNGARLTSGGFYLKIARTLDVNQLFVKQNKVNLDIKWHYNSHQYSGHVKLDLTEIGRPLVKKDTHPTYTDMWKDGAFRGVVLISNNLGDALAKAVLGRYLEYYRQEGFHFSEAKEINNVLDFLQDKINGSEPMDYFVKEAHAEGDEKHLFKIQQSGRLLRGTRKIGNKIETIDLMFPSQNQKTSFVTNEAFGKWIRERESKGQSQLVYLNSSCFSFYNAKNEIVAVRSPILLNIPTKSHMTLFANKEDNVMRAAIDGFRKGKSYKEIRTEMEKDFNYKFKMANIFIFPDEKEYDELVLNDIKKPINLRVDLFQHKNGKVIPYAINRIDEK